MLKTWTKVVDSGRNRLSKVHVESKLLETKPFQLIIEKTVPAWWVSQESRIERQQSRIESRFSTWFSILARIKCTVNLLLNCTVRSVVWRDKTGKLLEPRMNQVSKRENRVSSFEKPETSIFYIHYSKGFQETIYFLKNITITICTYSGQTDQQHLCVQFKQS